MNKKISQFELTNTLYFQDTIPIVQENENKNITISGLTTAFSNIFPTNDKLDELTDKVNVVDTKIESNYIDLNNKIKEGDNTVTNNLTSTVDSYYDVLNNKIIVLDEKHDHDISEVNITIQDWIDDIDNRSTVDQLHDTLNRLTVAENTITALAETIANGGSSGSTPGYHTQSTATIFPLSGYYKGTDASPLTTTDTLNQALSKLENQVEAISSSSGSLPVIKSGESTAPSDGSIYTSLKVKEDYLNKHGDTADGKVTFLQGIQGGNIFRSGWDGQGASLYPSNSKWNLELDNLFVRGNMTVNELTINEIKAVGGDILVTVADMECTQVDRLADCYRCYFDDADGTKYNQFLPNDMAICQKFDGKNVKRYWRKVNAVGSNYIDLSLDVCEAGSAIPEADDKIIQLGHMYEQDEDYNKQMDERRNAIFISAKGINAPRISFYKNIDDFTLADSDGVVRERVVIGGDETKFVGHIYQTSETGITRVPVYRGVWVQGNTYYYYDQVTHNGSLWICMKSTGTTTEPSDTEDDWQKQVAKGDAGKPSDDVAKWVEITGPRIFVYPDTTYTGIPEPTELSLVANNYGMTNPTYKWITKTDSEIVLSQSKELPLRYYQMPSNSKTLEIRCYVTDSDGSMYYDDVQVAKIANGAEGADGYYIDLSNYNVTIPYYNDGSAKVDLSSAYTYVTAYKGSKEINITNIVASTIEGTAEVSIYGNEVRLTSLDSALATIQLTITLSDGMVVSKNWYINNNSDGADGYNGEDAQYVYMSGEQYFHYSYTTTGSLVCNPSSITLTADSFNIIGPKYKWYWSIAGSYDWQLLSNEISKTLVVSPNGSYFAGDRKEISFKCEVYNDIVSYFDFMTINKVYDGDTVYRATLQNESTTVAADENGRVSDYSAASSTTRLRYGSNEITDYTISKLVKLGTGSEFSVDNNTKTVKCTNIPNSVDTAIAEVSFTYNGTVVDKVDFVVTKVKTGKTGEDGSNAVSIYCNSTSQPNRPTYTTIPSSSDPWTPDPKYDASYITWVSTGYAKKDGTIVVGSDGYRWSNPIPHSGLNGVDGSSISSVTAYYTQVNEGSTPSSSNYGSTDVPTLETGKVIYIRYKVTYTDTNKSDTWTSWVRVSGFKGDIGIEGPSLNFRGEWVSGNTYRWPSAANLRDIVYYNKNYYAVANKDALVTSAPGSNDWTVFQSFTNLATGLFFAEAATIAGWTFDNNYFYSNNKCICFNGSDTEVGGDYDKQVPFLAVGSSQTNSKGMVYNSTTKEWEINKQASMRFYPTGIIRLGEGGKETCGIAGTGNSDSDVRFWAGDSNRTNAPFRVTQGGSVYASNAYVRGEINCKKLTVSDYSTYGGPGVVCICHYNGHSFWNKYSVNGKSVSGISTTSTGYFTVTHNIGNLNYIAYVIGNTFRGYIDGVNQGSDTGSFIGSSRCTEISTNSCKMHIKNTDNKDDSPDYSKAIDIIFLSY